MSSQTKLTVAFLDQAPRAAAQELQQLPIREGAALVESVPSRLCGPVLHSMIPWHAARLVEEVSASTAAAILRQLSFADSVSLTRLVMAEKRGPILEALPTKYARRLSNALTYAAYQVGAWIDPEVPTLSMTDTVRDALRVLQDADAASHVLLETENHEKLAGAVPIREILRADSSVQLQHLEIVHPDPISNRASLSSIAFDDRWDDFLHLPVVGRRGNLLGGLSRKTLRHAIHEHHATRAHHDRSAAHVVVDAFWQSALSMVKLILADGGSRSIAAAGGANDEH